MAIKCQNQHDGSWMVYNTKLGTTAYIHRITEMFMGEHRHVGYRVDANGRTIKSAIPRFQTAKAWAVKYANGTILDCGCPSLEDGDTSCDCGKYDTTGGTL